jgi:Outer mitochondrial membrane transport complex protein
VSHLSAAKPLLVLCFKGQLPALDHGEVLVPNDGSCDFEAAKAIIAHLQATTVDLDAALTPAQRAELVAFHSLLTEKLEPATVFTTWCEDHSFKQFTSVRRRQRVFWDRTRPHSAGRGYFFY